MQVVRLTQEYLIMHSENLIQSTGSKTNLGRIEKYKVDSANIYLEETRFRFGPLKIKVDSVFPSKTLANVMLYQVLKLIPTSSTLLATGAFCTAELLVNRIVNAIGVVIAVVSILIIVHMRVCILSLYMC